MGKLLEKVSGKILLFVFPTFSLSMPLIYSLLSFIVNRLKGYV